MLKKLLVVSLIVLTSSFVYAKEKKVTQEYLVGDWECKVLKQKSIWANGGFTEYDIPKNQNEKRISFKIEDRIIYIRYGEFGWDVFNLDSFYNQFKYVKKYNSFDITESTEKTISRISDLKFEIKEDNEYITGLESENDKKRLNTKLKTEITCTRIK